MKIPSNIWAVIVLFTWVVMGACDYSNNADSGRDKKKSTKQNSFLSKYPLLNWPRKNAAEIGCMLEAELAYRDSVFNCDNKNYINKGDPCKNIAEYYEGLIFPMHLASKIHASVERVNLEFEHGDLRQISITFRDSLLKVQVLQEFDLPASQRDLPKNVMKIEYEDNILSKPSTSDYVKKIVLTGFDHMGSGDVDCAE